MAEGAETAEGTGNSPGLSPGPEPEDMPGREESFLRRWHFEIKIAAAYITANAGMLAIGLIYAALLLLVEFADDVLGSVNYIFISNVMTSVVYPLRRDSLFTFSFVISAFLLVLIACYFIAGRDIKKALIENLGLRINRDSLKQFALGVAFGTTLIVIYLLLCCLMGYSNYDIGYLSWYFSDSLLFTFFSLSTVLIVCEMLAVGIGEEIFFRGYLQRTIAGKYGIWPGIIIAAGLFSFTHGFGLTGLPMDYLGYLCFGVTMGCLYYSTGSLFVTIGFHFAWNFVMEESRYAVSPLSHAIGNYYIELAGFRIGTWATVIDIVLLGLFLLIYLKYTEIQKEKRDTAKGAAPVLAASGGRQERADDKTAIPFPVPENGSVKVKKHPATPGTIVFALSGLIVLIPALIFFITAGLAVAYGVTPSTPMTTDLVYIAIILILLAFIYIGIRRQLRGDMDEYEASTGNETQITDKDTDIREESQTDLANSGEVVVAEPDSQDSSGPAGWVAIILIILLALAISAVALGYI
jgi:membrane protease YdiL (CAAX protease family)